MGTAASGQNERPASRDFANCAVLLTGPLQSFDRLLDQLFIKGMCVPPLVSELHSQNAVGLNFRYARVAGPGWLVFVELPIGEWTKY